MRGTRAASFRRAVASVAASLSLHLLVGAGAASLVLGGAVGALWPDANLLIVEIVGGDDHDRSMGPLPPTVALKTASGPTRSASARPSALSDTGAQPTPDAVGLSSRAAPEAADVSSPDVPEAVARERESTAGDIPPPAPAPPVDDASKNVVLAQDDALPVDQALAEGPRITLDDRRIRLGDDGDPTTSPSPGHPLTETGAPVVSVYSRARLDEVTRNPSLSAQAESEEMVGRREVFEFLLDHPDFATHITRALRLARYRIWRTDDGMFIDDGWGATGQLVVVHAADGTRTLYAKGEFQHKMLPTIPGEAVVTIDYAARPTENGRELLQARISGQLKIDSAFATLMLKIASSVAREKAAKESRRLLRTFASVLRAIDETPAAVYASLSDRADVPRRELERFRVLLGLP